MFGILALIVGKTHLNSYHLKWYWLGSFLSSVIYCSWSSCVMNNWNKTWREHSNAKKCLFCFSYFLAVFSSSCFPSASWFNLLKEKHVILAVSWWRAGRLCWPFHLCCYYYLLQPTHAVLVDRSVPGCDDGGFLLLFVWYGSDIKQNHLFLCI